MTICIKIAKWFWWNYTMIPVLRVSDAGTNDIGEKKRRKERCVSMDGLIYAAPAAADLIISDYSRSQSQSQRYFISFAFFFLILSLFLSSRCLLYHIYHVRQLCFQVVTSYTYLFHSWESRPKEKKDYHNYRKG